MASNLCAGERPNAGCPYYVSWDAYVILGNDWINVYGGGYSVAGGEWRRLGEAFIYPTAMVERGYKGYNNEYYNYFGSLKLTERNGGGYTLTGYGGMWGRGAGKTEAEEDESFFYYIWSPTGQVSTGNIRFNFGGTLAHTDYYLNFGERCGGLPNFSTTSCSPPQYLGTAAPPPPLSQKRMECCDCNTISTIIESNSIQQLRAQEKLIESLKDHIDKRALEIILKDLEHLKALDFTEFLQAILSRINESEANLWNGISK